MATSVQKAIADLRKVQSCENPHPIQVDPEKCYDFKAKTSVQQALGEKGKGPAFINPQILKPNYRVYEDYVNAPTTRITGTTSGTIPVTIAPASSCYGHFQNVSHWSGPDTRSRHYSQGIREKKLNINVGRINRITDRKKAIDKERMESAHQRRRAERKSVEENESINKKLPRLGFQGKNEVKGETLSPQASIRTTRMRGSQLRDAQFRAAESTPKKNG